MNVLTAIIAVINATTVPRNKMPRDDPVSIGFDLIKSNPVAAIIVGIARRKENSTLVCRSNPTSMAPKIEAAARDTPGIMEKDWANPMAIACL